MLRAHSFNVLPCVVVVFALVAVFAVIVAAVFAIFFFGGDA